MRERYYLVNKEKMYIALDAANHNWYFSVNEEEAFLFGSKITADEVRKELGIKGFRITVYKRK